MSIEGIIRAQLNRAYGVKSWDENPLVTIGLSHAILSLKVTEEQLFSIVRGYIRRLAAAVHPDVAPVAGVADVELTEDRRKIMDAFELLDDEKTFSEALREFRSIKVDENREIVTLRTSLNIVRKRLDESTAGVGDLDLARRQLERQISEFNSRKITDASEMPNVLLQLQMAQANRDQWKKNFDNKQRLYDGLVSDRRQYQTFLAAQAYKLDTFDFVSSVNFAHPADVSRVEMLNFRVSHGDMLKSDGKAKRVPEQFRQQVTEYTRMLQKGIRKINKANKGKMNGYGEPMTMKRLRVFFGSRRVKDSHIGDGRVVGSISLESMMTKISPLSDLFIMRNMKPFVVPGAVLVTMQRRDIEPLPRVKNPETGVMEFPAVLPDPLDYLWKRASKLRRKGSLKAGSIILSIK